MLRNADVLYDHLVKYPRRIIIPHRLMPYPEPVSRNFANYYHIVFFIELY